MGQRTVRTWDAAEQLAAELEQDGNRILSMSEERSGVRVTWGAEQPAAEQPAAEQPAAELEPNASRNGA